MAYSSWGGTAATLYVWWFFMLLNVKGAEWRGTWVCRWQIKLHNLQPQRHKHVYRVPVDKEAHLWLWSTPTRNLFLVFQSLNLKKNVILPIPHWRIFGVFLANMVHSQCALDSNQSFPVWFKHPQNLVFSFCRWSGSVDVFRPSALAWAEVVHSWDESAPLSLIQWFSIGKKVECLTWVVEWVSASSEVV